MRKAPQKQKDAITRLAEEGRNSVGAVRKAFTNGIAPIQTAGSGSVSSYIQQLGRQTDSADILGSLQMSVSTTNAGSVDLPARPEIDSVEIDTDPTFGSLDSFYARVRVSVPVSSLRGISAIRLLRASLKTPDGEIPEAPSFSALIDGSSISPSRKGSDSISNNASRVAQLGRGNSLTENVSNDPLTPQKSVISRDGLRTPPPSPNSNRKNRTQSGLISIENVDRSVLENIAFSTNVNIIDPPKAPILDVSVGKSSGIDVLRGAGVSSGGTIVEVNNAKGFREITRISVSEIISRQVGDLIELDFYDPTVVFGGTYTYYVVTQNAAGVDGPRSRLVTLTVKMKSPPSTPDVLYSLIGGQPRFTIRCGSKFIDHIEVFRKGGKAPTKVRVMGTGRSHVVERDPTRTVTGFTHIGDVGVTADRSAVFIDSSALPGQRLSYRIYSVDSFGNKCQSPFECELKIPDIGQVIPLDIPTITAEQDVAGRAIAVTVATDDPRARSFYLLRREIGNHEHAYHIPTEPPYFTLGVTDAKRAGSRNGPRIINGERAWNGVLRIESGSAKLVDTAVNFDRIYQYSVQSVDVRGNMSSHAHSRPLMVAVKPIADRPVALYADVTVDEGGSPQNVLIRWDAGTNDFSASDQIGDQDVLSATSVRSIFQVERRDTGGNAWEIMPPVTGGYFIDPVRNDAAPSFRPSYAKMLREYDYRVIAMQSGGFISNYTDPVRVTVSPKLSPPPIVWVRSSDTSVAPLTITLSWNYEGDFVDSWEIQRAEVNKIYGSQITSMDSDTARSLEYQPYADVKREASAARSVGSQGKPPKEALGRRFFVDRQINLENSYFYRIRSKNSASESDWMYAGIILSDSPSDRKLKSVLSDTEKVGLARDPRPIKRIGNRAVKK